MVITDNLSSHKPAALKERVDALGAPLCFLPSCSSEFTAIEKVFLQSNLMLRKAGKCAVYSLWDLMGRLIDILQSKECGDYLGWCRREPE